MPVSATVTDPLPFVASSLLDLGSTTRAARLFKEHLAEVAWGADRSNLLERLAAVLGIPDPQRPTRLARARQAALRALEHAARLDLTTLMLTDAAYPQLLREIPDPPIAMWTRGDPTLLGSPAVAVVGSRRATPTGLAMARQLAEGLCRAGLTVVSGLARGIDAAAHRGALDAGGRTVAVLGCGLDVPYPPEHAGLATDVARSGLLLSEYPPGTQPFPSHFPLRNRIISGLSRAVVVVEASDRSGSLITARAALEQGREVLAVPGNVISGCYRGCHGLIKDGARLVESVRDVLDELGIVDAQQDTKLLPDNELAGVSWAGGPVSADELARQTGRPVPELLAELGALELEGRVARLPGGLFVRVDGAVTNRRRGHH